MPVERNRVRTTARVRPDSLTKDIDVCVLLNSRVRIVQRMLTNALQLRTSVMPMLTVLILMVHTTVRVIQDILEMDTTAQVRPIM